MARGEVLENILEIGVRLDVIELGDGDERAEHGPTDDAAIPFRKQMVFTAQRDLADGALDWIVVDLDLDAAVVEKAAERRPAREGVTNSLCQGPVRWDAVQVLVPTRSSEL
jgi:hypothetical protein